MLLTYLRKQSANWNKKDYYSPSIQNLMDFRIGFSSSKCALCDGKFEEQEFRLLISTSSYGYGEITNDSRFEVFINSSFLNSALMKLNFSFTKFKAASLIFSSLENTDRLETRLYNLGGKSRFLDMEMPIICKE